VFFIAQIYEPPQISSLVGWDMSRKRFKTLGYGY